MNATNLKIAKLVGKLIAAGKGERGDSSDYWSGQIALGDPNLPNSETYRVACEWYDDMEPHEVDISAQKIEPQYHNSDNTWTEEEIEAL